MSSLVGIHGSSSSFFSIFTTTSLDQLEKTIVLNNNDTIIIIDIGEVKHIFVFQNFIGLSTV